MTNWKEVEQKMNPTRSMIEKLQFQPPRKNSGGEDLATTCIMFALNDQGTLNSAYIVLGAFKNKINLLNMGKLLPSGREAAEESPSQQHRVASPLQIVLQDNLRHQSYQLLQCVPQNPRAQILGRKRPIPCASRSQVPTCRSILPPRSQAPPASFNSLIATLNNERLGCTLSILAFHPSTHTSHLTPHTSHIRPHNTQLTPHTSRLTPPASNHAPPTSQETAPTSQEKTIPASQHKTPAKDSSQEFRSQVNATLL